MKKRSVIIAIAVTVAILFAGTAALSADKAAGNLSKMFYEKWAGYEIRYPSGWVMEKPDKVTVLFAGPSGTDDYYTTVTVQNVASAKFGGKHHNVQSLISDLKAQFTNSDPGTQFFNEKIFAFTSEKGTPVNAITFGVTYTLQGEKLQQWAVIIPRASDLVYHVFFYTSPARLYERNIKTAYDMLATLKLLEGNK